MKLTGKNGTLRIYDSARVLHETAPLDSLTVDMVHFDGASTYTNYATELKTDDTNYVSNFLADNDDIMYIGSTSRFAMFYFLKGGASDYAVGSGAIKLYFYDGTDFATAIAGVVDGSASGGDCFAQDGYVSFKVPDNWQIGANAFNANLDSDKYYIAIQCTTSPSTDPDADVLCPVDGQFFEVAFAAMDFSGPMGRPKLEEMLVLDRGNMNSKGHYINGPDDVIYEPQAISFSALLDDVYNKDDILVTLECGDPDSTNWTATGTSAKGSTQNDGSNDNPAFRDTNKKAVNVQIIWAGATGVEGMAYYEVYFPPPDQTVSEAEDGIPIACQGGVYGVIERIHGFGVRY